MLREGEEWRRGIMKEGEKRWEENGGGRDKERERKRGGKEGEKREEKKSR